MLAVTNVLLNSEHDPEELFVAHARWLRFPIPTPLDDRCWTIVIAALNLQEAPNAKRRKVRKLKTFLRLSIGRAREQDDLKGVRGR